MCPVPAAAQGIVIRQDVGPWVQHFTVLSANAAVGALTGGILQALRGGSFADGFTRGAVGGALVYAGKRVAAEPPWGAGMLGREIAAVGTSVVRNAAAGRPSFERLSLPLGPLPVWLVIEQTPRVSIRPTLDLSAAIWVGSNLSDQRLSLDVAQSFSAGAPVFNAELRAIRSGDDIAQGVMVSRTITLSDPLTGYPSDPARTLAHERVHVIQSDFALSAWGASVTDAVMGRLPLGGFVSRWLLLDWFQLFPWDPGGANDPWEEEATFFSRP
ncbi:MAG TPA: hypothetical protein VNL18_11380 [Gemmatimonadales bacterium]|nr:hypothetical protein [Gemmatimonadales bacterium]